MKVDRKTPLNQLPELLTPEEGRKWIGFSRSGIYAMIRRGEIPSIRIGRRVFIPRSFFAKKA